MAASCREACRRAPERAVLATPARRLRVHRRVAQVPQQGRDVEADYNLIYGDLNSVAIYALSGAVCSLGTSGSHVWHGVPVGNLYFVILGSDGAGTESSWGLDSANRERNGLIPSGACGATIKNTSATCP